MRFLVSVSLLVLLCALACAQASNPATKNVAKHRTNELTLAGIRPGRVTSLPAKVLYSSPKPERPEDPPSFWHDACWPQVLTLESDSKGMIQRVRVSEERFLVAKCPPPPPTPWNTGLGLSVYDSADRVRTLYGEPISRRASTRDGQQIELLHYTFGWAGRTSHK
jgi:hypothetical protein